MKNEEFKKETLSTGKMNFEIQPDGTNTQSTSAKREDTGM